MKRILSGITISGTLHIGNYFGAIKQWVDLQNEYQTLAMLADLHALTTLSDEKKLASDTLKTAKLYVACGLNPAKTAIFAQSHVPEHAELAWILGTIAKMGELERMTQFKEKSTKHSENLGLFAYPVLMAADILLYQTDIVPVGDDQKQHVELTRDIATRFNAKFGDAFKIPEIKLHKEAARIMGLDDAGKKMSKTAPSEKNYIALLDSPDTIRAKIRTAVTDSGDGIKFDSENRPAVSNLMLIYSLATGKSNDAIESEFTGKNYSEFKAALGDALIETLRPIQKRFSDISDAEIKKTLSDGAEKARSLASVTLKTVKERIGLLSA